MARKAATQEEVTEVRQYKAPEPSGSVLIAPQIPPMPRDEPQTKKRLSSEERSEIVAKLAQGRSKMALAEEYDVSYSTINNIANAVDPVGVAMPPRTGSSLRERVYLLGAAYLLGEKIDEAEATELRQELTEEMARRKRQLLLSL